MPIFYQVAAFYTLFRLFKASRNILPYFMPLSIVRPLLRARLNPNSDSWAVLTGGTDGIGKQIIPKILDLGFKLIIVGRDAVKLQSVLKELKLPCQSVCPVVSDLSLADDQLLHLIRQKNTSVIINCAGQSQFNRFKQSQSTERMLKINCLALSRLVKPILSSSIPRRMIINISSSTAEATEPYLAGYSASKAFQKQLLASLQNQFKWHLNDHVSCIDVHPYYVSTKMTGFIKGFWVIQTNQLADNILRLMACRRSGAGSLKHEGYLFVRRVLPEWIWGLLTKEEVKGRLQKYLKIKDLKQRRKIK